MKPSEHTGMSAQIYSSHQHHDFTFNPWEKGVGMRTGVGKRKH